MRFDYRMIPALPRLAWAAAVRAGDPVVRVLHGAGVETRDDRFVEGAWTEPFAGWAFERSADFAGSGGALADGGVVFATPTNMYERLYALRRGTTLFVSSSLAFVLALSEDHLDPAYRRYYLDLLDHYRTGISVKTKRLRLAGRRAVALHDCCNVAVAPDGRVTRHEKSWEPPPATYADYEALVRRKVAAMIANAADEGRRVRYRPLAMVSHGYDSTAVAALARDAGCREAVTFARSHSEHGYVEDGGEAIAHALGMAVTTYERNDHAEHPAFRPEEHYLEPWGVDRTMAVMADQLAGTLLLSGRSGEAVWSRGGKGHWGLPDFRHFLQSIPGCALGELRMRIGFLHFAPATVAMVHAPRIHAWNDGADFAPWSIGGIYDKPIARRIVEEAGVARELFGQAKKGGHQLAGEERTWLERRVARVFQSPRKRAVFYRIFGNRFHQRWRLGSLEIQRHTARMVERYAAAIT